MLLCCYICSKILLRCLLSLIELITKFVKNKKTRIAITEDEEMVSGIGKTLYKKCLAYE